MINGVYSTILYNAKEGKILEASKPLIDIKTYQSDNNISVYEAVIIPQEVSKNKRLITITLENGTSYGYTVSNESSLFFNENTESILNLKIGKDKVTLSSPINVTDWTTGTSFGSGETVDVTFADPNFVSVLIKEPYNIPHKDGVIDINDAETLEALRKIEELYVRSRNISSLIGVKLMTNLKRLECDNNSLKMLDLSGLDSLQHLSCSENSLTILDLKGLINLQELNCYNNSLTTIDLSGLDSLQHLSCYENSLTTLDLSGLGKLQNLMCSGNSLTTIDLSGLDSLQKLDCFKNSLTILDLSGLGKLQSLECHGNS